MEENREYQIAVAILNDLQDQKTTNAHDLANDYADTKRKIEEHFDKCVQALIARKEALLLEFDKELQEQKKVITNNQDEVLKSIETCNEIINAGSLMFVASANAASHVWKSALTLKVRKLNIGRVIISLPHMLFFSIHKHGKVLVEEGLYATPRTGSRMLLSPPSSDNKYHPSGIYLNPANSHLYFCDIANSMIRKMNQQGVVSVFAGKKGDEKLLWPHGISMNHHENTFYVSSSLANTIIKITVTGTTKVFAGSGHAGYKDGIGTSASFNEPTGLAIDQKTGYIYVSDRGNHMIRRIAPDGDVITLAGSGKKGYTDGNGKEAQFNCPWGLFFDEVDKVLLVCDSDNHKIRRVTPSGDVTTLLDIEKPSFVAMTKQRTVLVSSFSRNNVSKIVKKGGRHEVSIIAGSGRGDDTNETSFFTPMGIAVDEKSRSCFVADWSTSKVYKYYLPPYL